MTPRLPVRSVSTTKARASADAPEAEVPCRAVRRVGAPRVDAVAVAVRRVAEVRPAAHRPRLARRIEPGRRPLPDVARHLVQPIAIRVVRPDGRRARISVVEGVE